METRSWIACWDPRTGLALRPGSDESATLSVAKRSGVTLLVDGFLFNPRELEAKLGRTGSAAELVLAAYERYGEGFAAHLRGPMAIVAADAERGLCLLVRDALGGWPLFHARGARGLLVSPSIPALLEAEGVSTALNRAHLAERLMERWRRPEETPFLAVRRVPQGHWLRVHAEGRTRLERHWDPGTPGGKLRLTARDYLSEFDRLLRQAVARCLEPGPAGVFLSGGLDSISVAALAVEECGGCIPLALSLAFPDPECNEEPIQRLVANELDMPQVLLPFAEAVGPAGLLAAALARTRSCAVPLLNAWAPAYDTLAGLGKGHGCRSILTGCGGDEWLGVSPALAADLMLRFDLPGLVRLLAANQRSYPNPPLAMLGSTLWRFGLRPILGRIAAWGLGRAWPEGLKAYRQRRERRAIPAWLAPDPSLRQELAERADEDLCRAPGTESFYERDVRMVIEHPLMDMEMEEQFETGRRLGLHFLHPYWDADLVAFLFRTPPDILNGSGRSKGLVRKLLGRRFRRRSFVRHRKRNATAFFYGIMRRELPMAYQDLEGLPILEELGLADSVLAVDRFRRSAPGIVEDCLWEIVGMEAWLQGQTNRLTACRNRSSAWVFREFEAKGEDSWEKLLS